MITKKRNYQAIYLLSSRFTAMTVVCTNDVELLRVLAKPDKYNLLQFPNVYSPETSMGKTKLKKVTNKELQSILKRNKSKIPKSSFQSISRLI